MKRVGGEDLKVCACHSVEEVTVAAVVSVASVQRHLTTCIYHSLIEKKG